MHIHEYQAKEIFKNFGISVPKSCLVLSSDEVEKACLSLGGERWVVKAQVHSGARGKAGGVKLVGTIEEAKEITNQLIGSRLVTNQTDSQGLPVEKILIESPQSINHEFYLSLLVDRQSNKVWCWLQPKVEWILKVLLRILPRKSSRLKLTVKLV